ncbi:MAG TPA: maleylpyruvate isomerase family mycothiol-dependent enzyme, partial [Acidimicrobiales bacterium]|nr:maleylpyruvate isomerase family mycothiol-dependent enzyme [Acidimicrobiales bacterium]
ARTAGLDARVPTCPDWTVAQLVAHQSMVHRWATEHISHGNPDAALTDEQILDTAPDLLVYYDEGFAALVAALDAAPPDLDVFTFLKDAPAPRQFWARRQAHETTMHAVDAQAAALGRAPATVEAGIDPSLAVDGLDELLRGFFTRGKSKLFDGSPFVMVVAPSDADRRWLVRVDERLTVDPGDVDAADADARLTGSAAALYLGLWNRGDEISVEGEPEVLARWHDVQRVTWT